MLFKQKGTKTTKDQVDLGSIKVQNDYRSNWPMNRCELMNVEMTKDQVDHKPMDIHV